MTSNRFPWECVVAGVLLSATQIMAQTTAVSQQTLTTGMVGITTTQTAQVNVLNLGPTGTCSIQISFVDPNNKTLATSTVLSPAAGDAVSFDVVGKALAASVTARPEIRGVVKTVPTPVAASATAVTPVSACSLMTTLEVFDTVSGVTQVFTSDTQAVPTLVALPVTTK